MNKIIIFGSGILAALAFFAVRILDRYHSPLTDFTAYLLLPFFCLVFLLSLFLVRIRHLPSGPLTRNILRGMRMMAIIAIIGLSIAIFWPRSYGTLPIPER